MLEFQQYLVKLDKYARSYINKLIKFVRCVINWGTIYELVSPQLSYSLKNVPTVRYGEARENKPRENVPSTTVEAVLPFLPPIIADMLRLQLLTGARPSEICRMRIGEINKTFLDGEIWIYVPPKHKTTWRGKTRNIIIGIEAREILEKYLIGELADLVFKNSRGTAFTPRITTTSRRR